MSTANGAIENKETYLQHVSLKNYKSIKDVEIDFKPGLNIIIGKNASGKTNFINGLNTILNFNYDEFLDSEFKFDSWIKGDNIEIQGLNTNKTTDQILNANLYNFPFEHDMNLKINGDKIKGDSYHDILSKLSEKNYFFKEVLIKYGAHYKENNPFISTPFSFVLINNGKVSREVMTTNMDGNQSQFVSVFFQIFYRYLLGLYHSNKIFDNKRKTQHPDLKEIILNFSKKRFENVNNLIFTYSPIESIRINPDFNIIEEEDGKKQTVNNFYLEFSIGRKWLPFNFLSDGTKRLFYIISEMVAQYYDDAIVDHSDFLNIILLEEPELGIHPHQLHQLMQFIKEQSREKQIIITTHSPQVLDVLEPDELDRLIICSYDSKNGTQLNHLSDKQVNKAKKYMKEDFLSDFWRFSDLEPA